MALVLDASPDELKVFLDEAEEQIQMLDEDIVRLEHEQENQDLLQEIFRAAHTLKGSSGALGHTRMANLTHAVESLLDRLRKRTLYVCQPLIDMLLESLDAIRILKEEIITLEESAVDFAPLTDRLREAARTWGLHGPDVGLEVVASAVPAPLVASSAVFDAAIPMGATVYTITAALDPASDLRAARCFQVYLALAQKGTILTSSPTEEEIEAEKVETTLVLTLASTATAEVLHHLVATVSDVLQAEVITTTPPAAVTAAPAALVPTDVVEQEQDDHEVAPKKDVASEAKQQPSTEQAKSAAAKLARLSSTVRIDVERLDALLNLVGELVIDRTRLVQLSGDLRTQFADNTSVEALIEATAHIGRIADELQEQIMKGRMLPVETVFNKMPRLVRDVARSCNKDVDFQMFGQETELDRSVIEAIGDPLIHLLRNAIDHGLETPEGRRAAGKSERGVVRLTAAHAENNILITIQDDGRGIDGAALKAAAVAKGLLTAEAAEMMSERESVDLVFMPGFSTAKKVTDVSGRGVGMDIVRANIEKLNGSVGIKTVRGQGTTFTIRLPLTLAIIQALLITLADQIYAIPLSLVTEVIQVEGHVIQSINRTEAILLRGTVLPLLRLQRLLGLPARRPAYVSTAPSASAAGGPQRNVAVLERPAAASPRAFPVVAVRVQEQQVGLVVDGLIGEQEVVIKSLGGFLGDLPGLSGSTILGDGRIALILDVAGLVASHAQRG